MGSLAFCLFQSISPGRIILVLSFKKEFSSWVLSLLVTIEWTQTCVLYHPTSHSRKKSITKTKNTYNRKLPKYTTTKKLSFLGFWPDSKPITINKKLYCLLSQKNILQLFSV